MNTLQTVPCAVHVAPRVLCLRCCSLSLSSQLRPLLHRRRCGGGQGHALPAARRRDADQATWRQSAQEHDQPHHSPRRRGRGLASGEVLVASFCVRLDGSSCCRLRAPRCSPRWNGQGAAEAASRWSRLRGWTSARGCVRLCTPLSERSRRVCCARGSTVLRSISAGRRCLSAPPQRCL